MLAGLVLAQTACVIVDREPLPSTSSALSSPPTHTPNPTSGTPVATVPQMTASLNPGRAELGASAWFVRRLDFASQDRLRGAQLRFGTLGEGTTTTIDLDLTAVNPASEWVGALPFVSGPTSGKVLYGYFDGSQSTVAIVDVRAGSTAETRSIQGAVVSAGVLAPGADRYFYLALDPATREEVGIFSAEVGGEPEMLVGPRAARGGTAIHSSLYLSDDGKVLVTYDCRDSSCSVRAYDVTSGALRAETAAPRSDPIGLAGDTLVLSGATLSGPGLCREPPCPLVLIDASTGSVDVAGRICTAGVMASSTIVVTDVVLPGVCNEANRDYSLASLDLGASAPEGDAVTVGGRHRLVAATIDQGVELPQGFVLLTPSGQIDDEGLTEGAALDTRTWSIVRHSDWD